MALGNLQNKRVSVDPNTGALLIGGTIEAAIPDTINANNLNFNGSSYRLPVTIVNGAAGVSLGVAIGALKPRGFGVVTPATWVAADIALDVSADNATFFPAYDNAGSRIRCTGILTSTAAFYVFPAAAWGNGVWDYVRLASINVSSGAAVNQTADRACTLVLMI